MKLAKHRKTIKQSLRQATLCFLVREGEVLLAMKKRGFGKGRWNGAGGKVNPGEKTEKAAVRETQEEIGVIPISLRQVATLDFYFPHHPDWNQQVIVFLADKWEKEPKESEEMTPKWFNIKELPFDSMWPDDIYWLPKVLDGTTLKAGFLFGPGDKILDLEVNENS